VTLGITVFSVIVLSVAFFIVMLSVVMLNVIVLSVVPPKYRSKKLYGTGLSDWSCLATASIIQLQTFTAGANFMKILQ
jgi:hypothetical protein